MRGGWPVRVRTVLLDAGGVLLDLDFAYLRRLIDARREPSAVGVEPSELSRLEALARREVQRQVLDGARMREVWRDYFHIILGGVHVPVAEQGSIVDALWDAHRRFGLWTVAVPGAPRAVTELRRLGYSLGVVSNAEGRVEHDLNAAGYAGQFETVVDSEVVGVEKPDPRIFRLAMERMQAEPKTTLFVGDVPAVDVEGARAAGITPVLVDSHDLYAALDVARIRSIADLPALLGAGPGGTDQNE